MPGRTGIAACGARAGAGFGVLIDTGAQRGQVFCGSLSVSVPGFI